MFPRVQIRKRWCGTDSCFFSNLSVSSNVAVVLLRSVQSDTVEIRSWFGMRCGLGDVAAFGLRNVGEGVLI